MNPTIVAIIIGSMLGGMLLAFVGYFIITAIRIRKTVTGTHVGVFIEKNGFLTFEGMKVDPEWSGDFVKDKYGGSYRIPWRNKTQTTWPPSAPGILREPVGAAIYARGDPNPRNEDLQFTKVMEALDFRKAFGTHSRNGHSNDDDYEEPEFYTALAVSHLQDENVAKQAAATAEGELRGGGGSKQNMITLILLIVAVAGVVISGIANYQSQQSLQKGLQFEFSKLNQTLGGIQQLVGTK